MILNLINTNTGVVDKQIKDVVTIRINKREGILSYQRFNVSSSYERVSYRTSDIWITEDGLK